MTDLIHSRSLARRRHHPSPSPPIRLYCLIITTAEHRNLRTVHVKATWASQCDKYLFISDKSDRSLPSLRLNVTRDGRDYLWGKTRAAFMHAYRHESSQFDWFLKADDDTYVHITNLRNMLERHKPTDSVHFGCKFSMSVTKGYMSGGAGYVLSREALRRFAVDDESASPKCRRSDFGIEDVEMGRCMAAIGVAGGDSRDDVGMHRWLPQHPSQHVAPVELRGKINWLSTYMSFPFKQVIA